MFHLKGYTTVVHEIAETVDTGGQMDLVILDFSKAFDFWRSSTTTELGVRRMDRSSLSYQAEHSNSS